MLGRRMLLLVAVLMGLTALAASLAPRQDPPREAAETATPTPVPTPIGESREPVTKTVSAAPGRRPARIEARHGDTVILQVTSETLDSVALLDLAAIEPVGPDAPARFELLADHAGSFDIELLQAERTIGTLVVSD